MMLADGQRRLMDVLLGSAGKPMNSVLLLFECVSVVSTREGEWVRFCSAGDDVDEAVDPDVAEGVASGELSFMVEAGRAAIGFFQPGGQYYVEVSPVKTEEEV